MLGSCFQDHVSTGSIRAALGKPSPAKPHRAPCLLPGLEVIWLGNHMSTSPSPLVELATMREIALNVNPHMRLGKVILIFRSREWWPFCAQCFSLSAFQSLRNNMFYLV